VGFDVRQHARAVINFQACSIDHSDISPFRINDLRTHNDQGIADCDKSSNVPRSLTGFFKYSRAITARSANVLPPAAAALEHQRPIGYSEPIGHQPRRLQELRATPRRACHGDRDAVRGEQRRAADLGDAEA
jgi:hypothetical protein